MIFAYFMTCIASTVTGEVSCSNSYTEMTSVIRKGESCEVQAATLQRDATNAILIENVTLVKVAEQTGCGTLAQVKAKATKYHLEFGLKGIESDLFQF
jgi:hypothetical protein